MALLSVSRPSDQSFSAMATPSPVNLMSKKKLNKGDRFRVSDTSGNVTAKKMKAGGPGSGRKKEIEDFLKKSGFSQHKLDNRSGSRSGDDANGGSHWHKAMATNTHGTHNTVNNVMHTVTVDPDGTWTHTVTGMHSGSNLSDLQGVPFSAHAASSISGTSVESLSKILARAFTKSSRKKLAKTGAAEPDGSYPIKNKKDYDNAEKDLNRTGRKSSDVAHVNKRAKQLGLKSASKKKMKSKNEDSIEYYSKGEEVVRKTKTLTKKMKDQRKGDFVEAASVTLKCSSGTVKIAAGGPGSGRHITVSTNNPKEVKKMHDSLMKRGWKMKDKNNYVHPKNGDRVTMNYSAGGSGSGRKAGMALGKMLRDALVKRMGQAIQISQNKKVSAGGPGSGRKPNWQSDSPNKSKLDALHTSLTKMGYQYKSSGSAGQKGVIEHDYKKKDGVKAILSEKKSGKHSAQEYLV